MGWKALGAGNWERGRGGGGEGETCRGHAKCHFLGAGG